MSRFSTAVSKEVRNRVKSKGVLGNLCSGREDMTFDATVVCLQRSASSMQTNAPLWLCLKVQIVLGVVVSVHKCNMESLPVW